MDSTPEEVRSLSSFSVGTWLKFILFSVFGVIAFFINIPIPAYQINIGGWHWGAVAAQSNVLCSHLTNFVKAALYTGNFKAMPFVVWAIGLFAVIDVFFLRPEKGWKDTITSVFSVFKIIGFVVLCMNIVDIYFGVHFGFMNWMFNPVDALGTSIADFVMARILVTICISIPCASLFLPFLVDYGLVDFVGVFVRLIMRPVFHLPGRAIHHKSHAVHHPQGKRRAILQLERDRLLRNELWFRRHNGFSGSALRQLIPGSGASVFVVDPRDHHGFHEALDERGFPGTRRSDHHDYLAFPDVQVDPLQDFDLSEILF